MPRSTLRVHERADAERDVALDDMDKHTFGPAYSKQGVQEFTTESTLTSSKEILPHERYHVTRCES